jgi:aryl-alcohol dehydrogenase-like predicted oxidoreductase
MTRRPLGRSGLTIHPLVLGGNVFGWTADESRSHAILDAFVAGGGNCIDTADVYSVWVPGHQGGESETVIGNWLARRGRRDDIVLATKVGMQMGPGRKGLSRAYVLKAVEDSLRRLRTDYIDLYFSHQDDAGLDVEEPLRAYEQLIRDGKLRAIGASNFSAARLRAALHATGLPRYEVLQPHYNLLERADFESQLQPLCIAEGIGVVCYFALASGYLTGKYRSRADLAQSARGQGVGRYLEGRGPAVLAALDTIATELDATPAQVALAWLMAQPGVTAPIASATSTAQLAELLGSVSLRLGAGQRALLEAASRQVVE